MPLNGLTNDNWIGRMPFAFLPDGEPLHDMEVKSLARGRMCVQKIIAEPERRGPHEGRQAGLRGNSIGFPQARVTILESKELPAPPEEAARFLSRGCGGKTNMRVCLFLATLIRAASPKVLGAKHFSK